MTNFFQNPNRRNFISGTAMAGIGGTSFLSMVANSAQAQTYSQTGYKAIVCVLLAGGCDSFNLLMPAKGAARRAYDKARTNLAIDASKGHAIKDEKRGDDYVLHPATSKLQRMYNEDRLSFIANIGPLIQPTSKEQYLAGAVPLPKGLLSHKDQIRHWQTSAPHDRAAKGWAGSMNDLFSPYGSNEQISRNISLSGSNIYQYANNTSEYAITDKGSVGLEIFDSANPNYQFVRRGVENVLRETGNDPFKEYYAKTIFAAHKNHGFFQKALAASPKTRTQFPKSDFGNNLKMIANTIAARQAIGAPQQIFFVNYGGWDHHDNVLEKQNEMLRDLSESLYAFDQSLQAMNVDEQVTTFTISDFGRTLTSNGNGSDHGWGGNIMVMGGDVKGGQILGEYPELTLGSALDIGSGIFTPTLPTDALYSSLAGWLGVNDADMRKTLPNIKNFDEEKIRLDLFA